jgi:hypothetical protein
MSLFYVIIFISALLLIMLTYDYFMQKKDNSAALALGLIYRPQRSHSRPDQQYQDLDVEMSPQLAASMLSQSSGSFKPVLSGVDISRPNYTVGQTINFAEDADVGSAGEYGGIAA